MSSEPHVIEDWSHIIYGRRRQKAERSAALALSLLVDAPRRRGPLVAYVAASALAEEMVLAEARVLKALK